MAGSIMHGRTTSTSSHTSASHGLVTPLMAVTANCDVLEAEASDQAGHASWVANIRAAVDEMATRIADMLMRMGGD